MTSRHAVALHAVALLATTALLAGAPRVSRAASRGMGALVEVTFAGTWSVAEREELRQALRGALTVAGLPLIDAARVAQAAPTSVPCRSDRCRIELARALGVTRLVYAQCHREARGTSLRLVLFNAEVGERVADLSRFSPGAAPVAPVLVGACRALLAREARVRGGVLRIRTRPPGAAITIDGRALGKTDADLPLASGAHVLVLQRPGSARIETRIDVHAGRTTVVDLTLEPRGARPSGARAGGAAGRPPATTRLPTAGASDQPRALRLWAYGLGAVGAAALVTGTTLYFVGCSAEEPYRQCPIHPGVRTSGIVLLAVGGAVAATGLGLWLYERRRHRAQVTVAPGSVSLTLQWP